MTGVEKLPKKPKTSRPRVKSGCRTCKLRKVRCDEGRPACRRCLSTGRICDGYGVWGGGGNPYGHHDTSMLLLRHPAPLGHAGSGELEYFEWFKYRTCIKLPGAFNSPFWDRLIFQASAYEPAVRHAVLALSSFHKKDMLTFREGRPQVLTFDERDQFSLRHYNLAIDHIQDLAPGKGRAPIRVALITCVMFVCLEFLRGSYKRGNNHLRSGLKLLEELQASEGSPRTGASHCIDDEWIYDALTRLSVQAGLLEQDLHRFDPRLQMATSLANSLHFASPCAARQRLDHIFKEIFRLRAQCRQGEVSASSPGASSQTELYAQQQRILSHLSRWLSACRVTLLEGETQMSVRDAFAFRTLRYYYSMGEIMASTCLRSDCEMAFDGYTANFISIVRQAEDISAIAFATRTQIMRGQKDEGGSVSDWGWIPPLYYTAVQCRIPQVRHRATSLLARTSHKEGIWDSILAARVAQHVVELEEGDFYKGLYEDQGCNSRVRPTDDELLQPSLPVLPESSRLNAIRVALPDEPRSVLSLTCRRKRDDGSWESLHRQYDPRSHTWSDLKTKQG